MASIITEAILTGSFELVGDRIAAILADELASQATLQSDPNLNVKGVYIERFVPFSHTDCPTVNVSLNLGDYSSFTRLRQDGTYQFFIDVYEKSATTIDGRGDSLANKKLKKLYNVCRAILSHHKYNTLAFAPPFIEHTEVKSVVFGSPQNKSESENMVMARMTFEVRVPETVQPITPTDIDGYTTKAILGLTDKGYLYGGDAYLPPVTPVCAGVDYYINDVFQYTEDSGGEIRVFTDCDPATITVNSNAFATVPSSESLNIGVAYQTSETNPIHSIVGSNIFITDPVVLPTNKIYIRPVPTGEIYMPASAFYPDYCDGWRVFTGQDISTQPAMGIPMLVDKSKRWKLAHTDNVFGNRFRLTGLTGGYYDPELANYYTASGVLSTYGEAFPSDYFIDHSTGLGGMTKANSGNITWASALTEIHSLSYAGFTGYFMPNEEEHCSIIDLGYATPLGAGATANPIFSLSTNSNKWTSTTVKGLETRAWVMQPNGDPANNILKSGVARYMAFRYHFNNS